MPQNIFLLLMARPQAFLPTPLQAESTHLFPGLSPELQAPQQELGLHRFLQFSQPRVPDLPVTLTAPCLKQAPRSQTLGNPVS